MAKSPDQLRQNTTNKVKIVAEIQELKSANYTLSTINTELEKKYSNLKIEHENLKTKYVNNNKDVAKTTEDTSNKGTVVNPSLIHTNFIAIPNTIPTDKSGDMTAKVQELEKKNNTLSTINTELEKKYSNLKIEHENLKTVSANTETEAVKNLKILNSGVSSEKVELEKKYTTLEEEYANLKNALASTEEKLKTVSISTDEKLKALENKNSTIFNEKAELEKEYEVLKAALASREETLKTVSTKNECTISPSELFIQEEYEALKIKYSNLKSNYDDLKVNAKASYDDLKSNVWDLTNKLSDGFKGLKIKFSNTNEKLEKEKITVDNESKSNSTISEKNAYNMLNSTIEKIKSEYFFSNDTGTEVKKDTATSINQRESNTKCFEISDSSLKSTDSESSDCKKIYSLHNFLDSIGMDKDDANHLQFLNFMSTNNATELESMITTNFNNFIKRYSYADKDGKKVIKYAEGQECFKMENEKVSTYGENSFSDECAPLVNLYILLQTANDNEIWHYETCDLTDHDDAEFNKILAFEFIDN
ncbi:MAG: hypothetical protein K2P53_02590 [Rickettsiales bacterium]|jgi:chromosome segregation ATPase|nr:hypothetical protein [Rickettsiales bacterium]